MCAIDSQENSNQWIESVWEKPLNKYFSLLEVKYKNGNTRREVIANRETLAKEWLYFSQKSMKSPVELPYSMNFLEPPEYKLLEDKIAGFPVTSSLHKGGFDFRGKVDAVREIYEKVNFWKDDPNEVYKLLKEKFAFGGAPKIEIDAAEIEEDRE